jgi:hypothetical protein
MRVTVDRRGTRQGVDPNEIAEQFKVKSSLLVIRTTSEAQDALVTTVAYVVCVAVPVLVIAHVGCKFK